MESNKRGILFAAAWRGEEQKVKEILSKDVTLVNAVDENGVSALRFAAQFGHKEIVDYLLNEVKADPRLRAKDGMDALVAAVEEGHVDIVKMLLKNGAKARTRALVMARSKNNVEMERILLDAGAKEPRKKLCSVS